jgi:cytoskeletal protein CcmA (bactofilin family)
MASESTTVIGRTTRVRGRVTGAVDLDVQGFVEGEISVGGDVTIDAHGIVGAGVRGRRLLVRGAVKGDLVGDESVLLEDGARVLGDVRAPRVAIAPGALVRGYVQTGEGQAPPARTVKTQAAAARPAPAKHAAERNAAPPKAAPSKPAKHAAPVHIAGAGHTGPRRPPPPVVPALKKAKGQIAKKKER